MYDQQLTDFTVIGESPHRPPGRSRAEERRLRKVRIRRRRRVRWTVATGAVLLGFASAYTAHRLHLVTADGTPTGPRPVATRDGTALGPAPAVATAPHGDTTTPVPLYDTPAPSAYKATGRSAPATPPRPGQTDPTMPRGDFVSSEPG
jgi:hypothetical protein